VSESLAVVQLTSRGINRLKCATIEIPIACNAVRDIDLHICVCVIMQRHQSCTSPEYHSKLSWLKADFPRLSPGPLGLANKPQQPFPVKQKDPSKNVRASPVAFVLQILARCLRDIPVPQTRKALSAGTRETGLYISDRRV
jgi:hypothetical protein